MRRTTAFGALLLSALTATLLIVAGPAHAADGWLGVSTQSVDNDLRDALNLRSDGVLVTRVVDDSPADRAGLRKGDVLLTFNSRSIGSPDDLRDFVRDAGDGRSVALRVNRDGRRLTFEAKLGSLEDSSGRMAPRAPDAPDAPDAPKAPRAAPAPGADGRRHVEIWKNGKRVAPDEMPELKGLEGLKGLKSLGDMKDLRIMLDGDGASGRGRLGVQVQDMSDDLADAMGLSDRRGAFVLEVLTDTPASRAGVRAGDVILSVEGRSVAGGDELRAELRRSSGKVQLEVSRRGSRRTIEAEIESSKDSGEHRFEWHSGDSDDDGETRVFRMRPEVRRDLRVERDSRDALRRRSEARDDDQGELRRELEELRRELRELRRQLREEGDR